MSDQSVDKDNKADLDETTAAGNGAASSVPAGSASDSSGNSESTPNGTANPPGDVSAEIPAVPTTRQNPPNTLSQLKSRSGTVPGSQKGQSGKTSPLVEKVSDDVIKRQMDMLLGTSEKASPSVEKVSDDVIKKQMDMLLGSIEDSEGSKSANKEDASDEPNDSVIPAGGHTVAGQRHELPTLSGEAIEADALKARISKVSSSQSVSRSGFEALSSQAATTQKLRTMSETTQKKPGAINAKFFDKYSYIILPVVVLLAIGAMGRAMWTGFQGTIQLDQGKKLLKAGNPSSALPLFEKAISVSENSKEAYLFAGATSEKLNKNKKALDFYMTGSQKWPEDPEFLRRSGKLALKMERYQAAADAYTRLFKVDPERPSTEDLNNRAFALAKLDKWNEALMAYAILLKRDPKDDDALVGNALCQFKFGRYEDATEKLDEVLKRSPDHVRARLLRGQCYLHKKDYVKAKADFDYVLAKNPKNMEGLIDMAALLQAQGKGAEALAMLNQAVAANPESIEARKSRADALLAQNQFNKALSDMRKIADLDDKAVNLFTQIRDISQLIKKHQSTQAIAESTKLMEKYPKFAGLYVLRSRANAELQDYNAAIADCDQAMKLGSKDGYLYRARYNVKAGNNLTAINDYKAAISHAPKLVPAYIELGNLEITMSRSGDALRHFRTAASLDRKNAQAAAGIERARKAQSGVVSSYAAGSNISKKDQAEINSLPFDQLLAKTYDAMHQNRFNYAVEAAMQCIKLKPNSIPARKYLFHALIAQGRAESAASHLPALQKLGAASDEDVFNLVRSLKKSRAFTQAISVLQDFLKTHPDSFSAIEQISLMYVEAGHMEQAEAFCNQIIKDSKNDKLNGRVKALMSRLKEEELRLQREYEEQQRIEQEQMQQNSENVGA